MTKLGKSVPAIALLMLGTSCANTPPAKPIAWTSAPTSLARATFCDNAACEPVTVTIANGQTFVIHRWGNHREQVKIANIATPTGKAKCAAERDLGRRAMSRLSQLLDGATLTMARISQDGSSPTIAMVSVNGRDVGNTLIRERLAFPAEPRSRSWCFADRTNHA